MCLPSDFTTEDFITEFYNIKRKYRKQSPEVIHVQFSRAVRRTDGRSSSHALYMRITRKAGIRAHIDYFNSGMDKNFRGASKNIPDDQTIDYEMTTFKYSRKHGIDNVESALKRLRLFSYFTQDINPFGGEMFPYQSKNQCVIHALMFMKCLHEKRNIDVFESFNDKHRAVFRLDAIHSLLRTFNIQLDDFLNYPGYRNLYLKLQDCVNRDEGFAVENDNVHHIKLENASDDDDN
jgi:hypothetical protein